MKAYFDTNIYSFIDERGDFDAVLEYLARRHVELLGSDQNLMELYRVPDVERRKALLRTLTELVTHRLQPVGFVQTKELVAEVRHWHRDWLRPQPDLNSLNVWLNLDRRKWRLAKETHDLPKGVEFDRVVYEATGMIKRQQRDARAALRATQRDRAFTESEAEEVWRLEANLIWSKALFGRVPAMRDYYDYFTAYAELGKIVPSAWRQFWKSEVRGELMPAIKLSNLAAHLQQSKRATSGNAGDLNHLTFLGACDAFLTADVAFYDILVQLREYHEPLARPILVDRQAPSAIAQIQEALERRVHASSQARTAAPLRWKK